MQLVPLRDGAVHPSEEHQPGGDVRQRQGLITCSHSSTCLRLITADLNVNTV
jgi:hypothetical protein